MAASAKTVAGGGRGAQRAPHVNLFDLPELLPGAQPSANPAQREAFEQRCVQLYQDAEAERLEEVATTRAAAGVGAAAAMSELEAMFPALDPALVRAIRADAPSAAHALETLLALSAATADLTTGGPAPAAAPAPPPLSLGVEDFNKFPSLVDADGWQVTSQQVAKADEDLGSAWRDRAKAAADLPAPRRAVPTAPPAGGAGGAKKDKKPEDDGKEHAQPLTDYEFRQQVGQRRAKHRAQYGRGRGRGRGAGAGGTARGGDSEGSESEVSEDGAGEA